MVEIIKEYSSINIEDIRKIRGHRLASLYRGNSKIPDLPGIYVWRYWPNIESTSATYLLDIIESLPSSFPKLKEQLSNSKTKITLERTPFGLGGEKRFLGVKGDRKVNKFREMLNSDEGARLSIAHTLELLLSYAPPLYVGKAKSLRSRLLDHFENRTSLLTDIEGAGIKKEDVYISFILGNFSIDEEDENTAMIEEILQRLTNPVYTKRFG